MMEKLWLQCIKKPEVKYEVLKYDKATGIATLKGKYATLEQKIDKEMLVKTGYVLMKESDYGKVERLRAGAPNASSEGGG
jgi:hypothetical protein